MTALSRVSFRVASIWLKAAMESLDPLAPLWPLSTNPAWRLTFRQYRPNDEILPLLQLPLEDGRDFRKGVVRDAERNLDRLQRILRVEFPPDRRIGLRRARRGCSCRSR